MMAEKKILFQFPITYLAKRVSNPQVPLKGALRNSSSLRLGQERSRYPKVKGGQGGIAVAKFDEI